MAELVLEQCRARGWRLATAESCTGGRVAAALTAIPGSSEAFAGGVVSYSNELKMALLGVSEQALADHGAVSPEVAREMADGARERLGADVAVSVTGVAGPGGGTPEKPVGLVFSTSRLRVVSCSGGSSGRRSGSRCRSARRSLHCTWCARIFSLPHFRDRRSLRCVRSRGYHLPNIRSFRHSAHRAGEERVRMEREQALEAAVNQIERQFGKGAIMKMGDASRVDIDAISTGALSLDLGLGIGGLPRGRVVEIFGPESSGKTTLCYHVIAEAQRKGGLAAFIDAEHSMDPQYAKRIGVNVDELLVSQPDNGEQALEIAEMLIRSTALDVVVIDSVAALVPRAEIEGEMGDAHVGIQARLMSQALRKIAGTLNRTGTICIFTNQLREKIGVMFGSPETTPGGRALKFYASVRLDIRRIETLKEGTEAVGNRCRVKIVKNKVAPPFKQAEFDIAYGEGISWEGSVLDVAIEKKVIQKSGSYFSFGDERLGQGRTNVKAFMVEHPDVTARVLEEIQASMPDVVVPARTAEAGGGSGPTAIPSTDADADAEALTEDASELTTAE